ncbi:hypothetical protein GCM10010300_63920 [Streptomyces olivaceoviridis]|uniref:DUF6643 family protein n=1 Tax=Streptomyces olivaceoviridis TaxID=1921 RepID=UPI00167307AC|nr:DUF6643 family protein [Streptomyces olivaceoviridis]GGZ11132.1 hypothetical protein GCM10010300_63920 [Streptomyces olivaceoviridis]
MTSPRSTYGGGYYSASFPETPIYDSLVAERGTPQIAPIRVPAAYDTGGSLPALPSALPALPAAPAQQQPPAYGYPQPQQPAPLAQAPTAYIPQQASAPRGYPGPQAPQQQRPMAPGNGYEAMRPAAPRPAPAPYQDPYNNQQYRGY